MKIAQVLAQPRSFFTDPYVIAESHALSYRASQASPEDLRDFEVSAKKLVSANRRFRDLLGITKDPVQPELRSMSRQMPLDFAVSQGERIAESLDLGSIPAADLRERIEERYGIAVLFVDGSDRISAAACRLCDESVILINRHEPDCRRTLDLGHEFFHILTWGEMPPPRIDEEKAGPRSKIEQLADAFTAGLLMPRDTVVDGWNQRGDLDPLEWIHQTAQQLMVSSEALYWHLINLKLLRKNAIDREAVLASRPFRASRPEKLYNREFVSNLQRVLEDGRITVLKAAHLLDCDIVDLQELFDSYEFPVPFDL